MRSDFRTDINGLRAYAVLAVMLFHFEVRGFSGGFIGVDIFFVISGYLMTRIIIEKLDNLGKTSWAWLLNFYLSRARRIIPALLVLCLILGVIGWFSLPRGDYKQLGTHALYALAFLSNVKFWSESGYFDAVSHDKWLLHTWSLSVEWQFYLVFPVILMIVWHRFPGRKAAIVALTIGIALSVSLSIGLTPLYPTAAFYFLPTRAWELFAGGLVYLGTSHWRPNDTAARTLEGIGFALIIWAMGMLSDETPWPGISALIPVLGAVLVLVAARQKSGWTRARSIQALGTWSYSVYLWHWPLAVMLVYLEIADRALLIVAAIALSILLGWLSYKFIEVPARRKLSQVTPIRATFGLAGLVFLVAISAFSVQLTEGFSKRLSPAVERIASEAGNFNKRRAECHGSGGYDFNRCIYGGPNISAILVGDSHAAAVATAVQEALPGAHHGVLTFTYTSCPTIFGIQKRGRPDLKCAEFNNWVMQEIAELPMEVPLIIVNRTSANVFGSNRPDVAGFGKPSSYFSEPVENPTEPFKEEFSRRLAESVCRIAETRPVYLVRPIPEMPVDVPKVAARKQLLGEPIGISVPIADYHARHSFVWRAQDEAREACGVGILNPLAWLCDDTRCDGLREKRPLYYDSHHLSEYGNKYLVPMFREAL